MREIVSLITPLLLHMVLSELSAVLLGGRLDATACTAVSSLLVIPIAAAMYRRDCAAQRKKDGGFGLLCFVFGGVLNLAWSGILNALHITQHFSNAAQEALFGGGLWAQIVGLGILVPIAEELIFRGLTYTRMKRFFSVRLSVVFSAALFAVYHGNPIQMIYAFPMAVVLALVYERGGHLVFPVLLHMGANLTAVFVNMM